MKPLRIVSVMIAILFFRAGAYASREAADIDELVQRSDVIARVAVLNSSRNPAVIRDWAKREAKRGYGALAYFGSMHLH